MSVKHKYQPDIPDPTDSSLVGKTRWRDDHVISGGTDGQCVVQDSAQENGHKFGWFIPAEVVGSDDEVPLGQCRVVDQTVNGVNTIALKYNKNGTVIWVAGITNP